ncbi:MAG: N-acetylmuramoyl-L-alanine amidase [Saprospiraceae bacterium]|nr:N-acetylmuramoyl-L-alanine amidase [Saprospiraceae bacterium]
MTKAAVVAFFLVVSCQLLQAQHSGNREVLRLAVGAENDHFWQSTPTAIPLTDISPFLSFFVEWEDAGAIIRVRFSTDGHRWENWQRLKREAHNPDKIISEQIFADPSSRFFQLAVTGAIVSPQQLLCHFFSPGLTDQANVEPSGTLESLACPCVQPAYMTRNQWCPSGNCPPNPTPSSTVVKHLIVHHSAGANISSDWPAVVRSIWDFHVNGNGWADIGYNWLIDPNGQVYEGRGDNILGAHFCGANGGTMGICMLGTFTSVTPADTALNSLQSLLAWKSCDADILPLDSAFHASSGLILDRISGHRDGCATECPGTTLYAMLPSIRSNVSQYIADDCATVSAFDPILNELSVTISPNPANSSVTFTIKNPLEGEVEVAMLDMSSRPILAPRRIFKSGLEMQHTFPVDQLQPGIYFIQLRMAGHTGLFKVLIQP